MTQKEKALMNAIHHFEKLLSKSGMKNQLIEENKTETISIYEEIERLFYNNKAEKIIKISDKKIFKLKTSGCCNTSISKNCLKLNPNQLSLNEQCIIKKLLENEEFSHLPLNYLHSYAERQGVLIINQNTFYKYANMLNIKRKYKTPEEYKVEHFSPKASYPFQILHMDSTYWYCENGERVHIHFIQDNFSKKILGGVVSFSTCSKAVTKNLAKAIQKYHLQDKTLELYCDDGPENKKDVDAYLAKNDFKIKKVIANFKTKKSNNSIEAWNKTFKRIVLKKYRIASKEMMIKKLPEMIDYYNNMYIPVLHSLTPNEVVAGKTRKDIEKELNKRQTLSDRLKCNRELCCFLKEAEDFAKYDCKTMTKHKNKP